MPIVILQLPDVKRKTETRPRECRYCKGETFQRWGGVRKLSGIPRCKALNVPMRRRGAKSGKAISLSR